MNLSKTRSSVKIIVLYNVKISCVIIKMLNMINHINEQLLTF